MFGDSVTNRVTAAGARALLSTHPPQPRTYEPLELRSVRERGCQRLSERGVDGVREREGKIDAWEAASLEGRQRRSRRFAHKLARK